jgi:hypothetical protein
LEESRVFIIRSLGIVKCETLKSQKQEDSFRFKELEESRLFIIKSPGIVKCETPKTQNRHIDRRFGYRELEKSRVETLQHRSPEVLKCEMPKILK